MGFPILAVSERLEHEKVQTTLELYGHLYPDVHGNVAQQLQDSAAADLSPAAWQNAQKGFLQLFKLGKSKDIIKYICLSFISF